MGCWKEGRPEGGGKAGGVAASSQGWHRGPAEEVGEGTGTRGRTAWVPKKPEGSGRPIGWVVRLGRQEGSGVGQVPK